MARIRTIKPETFTSESISSLSLAGRWTFVGLWTHVDDEGRARDNAKIIRGALWPNEDETVTSKHVESHLAELEDAEMICRYEADGARYFHVVNFHRHQKISHPTPSKLPRCPHETHPGPKRTPPEDSGNSPKPSGGNPEPSGFLEPRAHAQDARTQATHPRAHTPEVEVEVEVEQGGGSGGPTTLPPTAGAVALRIVGGVDTDNEPTAQIILGEYLERCTKRPPGAVIGQLGKLVKAMLAEGIDPNDIRRGLAAWKTKGLHPSTLPSVVNEVMNASTTIAGRPSANDYGSEAHMQRFLARAEAREQAAGGWQ